MKAWLETKDGSRIHLHGACLIGRSSTCRIVLADTHISRRHTLVQQQNDDEFWVVDLGSSNGTRLNGRRLAQPCRLKVGDVICIHNFEYHYRVAAPTFDLRSTNSLGIHAAATKRVGLAIQTIDCWLLLADINGSTRLSQTLPPDDWAQMVGRWLLNCRDDIESVSGIVNKYLGDGLFAYLPDSPEAAQSIRELTGRLAALQALGKPPFHLVFHHGSVTMGGVSARDEESLLGPEVNFAFRLEKVASRIQAPILLSASAAHLWPCTDELLPLGGQAVANFDGKHEVFGIKI